MIHHMARCSASSSARRRRASRALGVCRSPSTSSASSCGCSLPSTGTSLACHMYMYSEPARSASPGQPVGRARPPDRSLRRVRLPARHVPAMRFPDPPLRPAARRLLRRGARLARDRAEIGRRFRPVLRRGREGFPVVHTHKAGHRARDSGHGALLPLLHPTARTSLRLARRTSPPSRTTARTRTRSSLPLARRGAGWRRAAASCLTRRPSLRCVDRGGARELG